LGSPVPPTPSFIIDLYYKPSKDTQLGNLIERESVVIVKRNDINWAYPLELYLFYWVQGMSRLNDSPEREGQNSTHATGHLGLVEVGVS
jgi:hypothetical protein